MQETITGRLFVVCAGEGFMGLDTDMKVFLAYAAAIVTVYFAARMFTVPVKVVMRLLVNSVLGGLAMMMINSTGLGVVIPVNFITAAAAGAAGIPGIAVMMIYYLNIL